MWCALVGPESVAKHDMQVPRLGYRLIVPSVVPRENGCQGVKCANFLAAPGGDQAADAANCHPPDDQQ